MIKRKINQKAFTVVEIIIVIVIIAILATITTVGYNFVIGDARDAARRQTASELSRVIQAFIARKEPQYIGGNGATAPIKNGYCQDENEFWHGGWLHSYPEYPCDIGSMMQYHNMISEDLWNRVQGNKEAGNVSDAPEETKDEVSKISAFMFFRCQDSKNNFVLFYYLKKPTDDDRTKSAKLIEDCIEQENVRNLVKNRYKMNAAIEIN